MIDDNHHASRLAAIEREITRFVGRIRSGDVMPLPVSARQIEIAARPTVADELRRMLGQRPA